MALAVGACLQDRRYQIQDILKATDVDVTYQAIHTYLAHSVILKELRPDVNWTGGLPLPNQALMTRLNRLSQCRHTCLGKMLDCFEEGDRLYLVLPTNPVPTLEQWLSSHGPVAPTIALDLLKPLVNTLEQLHQQELVHGTLTPQTLHYCSTTRKLIIADISWQLLLTGLLANHHHTASPLADTLGLARITYSLLTGESLIPAVAVDTVVVDTVAVDSDRVLNSALSHPQLTSLVQDIQSTALAPIQSLELTPTEWFMQLQMDILAPAPASISIHSSSIHSAETQGKAAHSSIVEPRVDPPSDARHEATSRVETNSNAKPKPTPRLDDSYAKSEPSYPVLTAAPVEASELLSQSSSTTCLEHNTPLATSKHQTKQRLHQKNATSSSPWFSKRWLPYLLGATSIITMVSGGVLGYTFRAQDTDQLENSPIFGSELFGRDQDFPPSDHWPGNNSDDVDADAVVLFEQQPNPRRARPVVQTTDRNALSNNGGGNTNQRISQPKQWQDRNTASDNTARVEAAEPQNTTETIPPESNNIENGNANEDVTGKSDVEIITPVMPNQANENSQSQFPGSQRDRPLVEPVISPAQPSPPAPSSTNNRPPAPDSNSRADNLPSPSEQGNGNQPTVSETNPGPTRNNGGTPAPQPSQQTSTVTPSQAPVSAPASSSVPVVTPSPNL